MTNGDRIRQMTDEELAKKLRCDSCLYQDMEWKCKTSDCDYGILAWLRKDVSEDDIQRFGVDAQAGSAVRGAATD